MLSDDAHPGADATDDASEPATPTSPTPPCGAGPVRRPLGPKSRRPPTQMLSREAAASAPSAAAEAVLSPTIIFEEAEALDPDPGEECTPAGETQDEDAVAAPARSPIPMRRLLPRGAVPLMVPGGAGGLQLPRFSRVPSPHPPQDGSDATASAAAEEPLAPKPRRIPGPAAAMPGLGVADPLALRQQLRKTVMPRAYDSHLPDNHEAADHVELLSPSPPAKQRQPRPLDSPDGLSPESPAPRLRRTLPGAPTAAPLGMAAPDFLAARQHLRKTVAPGASPVSPEAEPSGAPQLVPLPQPHSTPSAKPPPPQLQHVPPPPPLPPKPRERRVGGVRDEDGDKTAVH